MSAIQPIEASPEPHTYMPREDPKQQINVEATIAATFAKEEANVKQRRSLTCNSKYICYALLNHPMARVMSKYNNNRTLIRGHKKTLVDVCFVNFLADVLVAAGADGMITIHNIIENPDTTLKAEQIGSLDLGEGRVPWGIAAAVPPLAESLKDLSTGYILVAESKVTSFSLGQLISKPDTQNSYEVPQVVLADCQNDFAVSNDGSRVVVGHETTVTVFLLPSPAKHAQFMPHAGDMVSTVAFGASNDTIITCSRDNSFVRVWSMSDVTPHCVQTICLGDGSAKFKASMDVTRQFMFFSLLNTSTLLVLSIPMSTSHSKGFESIAELNVSQPVSHFTVTAKKKEQENPVLFVRYDENISAFSYAMTQLRNVPVPVVDASPTVVGGGIDIMGKLGGKVRREGSTNASPIIPTTTMSEQDVLNSIRKSSTQPSPPTQTQSVGLSPITPLATSEISSSDLDVLLSHVTQVTQNLARATQQIALLQQSVTNLTQSTHKAQDRYANEMLRRVSSGLDQLSTGAPTGGKQQQNGGSSGDALASAQGLLQNLPSRIEDIVRQQVSSYATVVISATRQSIQNAKITNTTEPPPEVKNAIVQNLRQIKDVVKTDALTAALNNLSSSTNVRQQQPREIILAHLSNGRLDDALVTTLELRRPELSLWLLMDAAPISTWSDAVIECSLQSQNVLSLVQAVCSAMATNATQITSEAVSTLLGFLSETTMSYRQSWRESINPEIYKGVKALCIQALQVFQEKVPAIAESKDFKKVLKMLQSASG